MEKDSYEQVREQILDLPFETKQAVRTALEFPNEQRQQLIEDLPERRPVRVSIGVAHDFSPEQAWLRENRHLYPGEYLAVSGGQLLAHGTDPRAVMAVARTTGQDFLISHVPPPDEIYGGGLW